VIGGDISEMLDVVPAQYRVRVIRRPRYGCRGCEGAVEGQIEPGFLALGRRQRSERQYIRLAVRQNGPFSPAGRARSSPAYTGFPLQRLP
jgi:hypothetical protein